MGGNAIVGAVRVDKSTFNSVTTLLDYELECRDYKSQVIAAYREKQTFGDVDILVSDRLFKEMTPKQIAKQIFLDENAPFSKNGNVLSVGWALNASTYLQVDLIATPEEEWDFALNYFSWNDIGNLIGRIAHKMGLKFGHDGLWMPMRDGTNLFHSVLLTRDFDKALTLLGYDPEVYARGFDSLEDIFKYTASSPYFNPSIYLLENRNHTARTRDRKRKVYMEFLDWLVNYEGNQYEWNPDKEQYLAQIFDHFPEAEIEYDHAKEELYVQQEVKKKFNGLIVADLTGLQGKDLGELMSKLTKTYPFNDKDALYGMSPEEIISKIKEFQL